MDFTKETLRVFLTGRDLEGFVHASNYLAKLNIGDHLDLLLRCAEKYREFHLGCNNYEDIGNVVSLWNDYLNFVRTNNRGANGKPIFSSQSKFESTILEEVLYRLFKNYESDNIMVGGTKAFSNMFFSPPDFKNFKIRSDIKINTKDQDFAIYKQVNIGVTDCTEPVMASVPVFAAECKTYLDKTMLEGSVATAEKIKNGNPYCRFCIVTERYDVDKKVDIKSSRIDQIYILKKDATKRNMGEIDIAEDVVQLFYDDTIRHLNTRWMDIERNIRERGTVLTVNH